MATTSTIAEIKSTLLQYVADTDDEKILRKVQEHFSSLLQKEKKIVAYSAKGIPLTIEGYRADVQESLQQYKKGKVISQEDVERRK